MGAFTYFVIKILLFWTPMSSIIIICHYLPPSLMMTSSSYSAKLLVDKGMCTHMAIVIELFTCILLFDVSQQILNVKNVNEPVLES